MDDLQDTTKVKLDRVLDIFLAPMAAPPQPNSDQSQQTPTLLEQCLTAVNPSCNAPVKRVHENPEAYAARTKLYEESITACMKDYCKPGLSEIDRRPPFVKLSNAVLELVGAEDSPLKELLRRPDDTRILFRINHPELVALRHDESNIDRYPDIVIVAEESVRKAFNNSEMTRSQLLDLASTPTSVKDKANLPSRFPVAALLSCVELRKKADMVPPPDTWSRGQQPRFVDPEMVDDITQGRARNGSRDTHVSTETSAAANNPSTGVSPSVTIPSAGTSSHSTGQKRKAVPEDEIGLDSHKTNRQRTAVEIEPQLYIPAVQSASYALLSLNRAVGVLRVIGMFVEDQTLWLRIYDRQGVIQSYGLDFVKDFPRFVVLLAAFQRFNRQDWGFNPDLEPPPGVDPTAPVKLIFTTPATDSTPIYTYTVTLTNDILYEHPTFCGRASHIETVIVERDVEGFNDLKDQFVLKVGWAESARISEVEIIAKAKEIADHEVKGKRFITGHLPEVICSKDLPTSYATGAIRNALGLLPEHMCGGSRTCRLIVLVKLDKLTGLPPLRFLSLFRAIVTCHYFLWINGVKHCDISLQNLMRHPRTGWGVLNDFDLSRVDGEQPENLECTGTVPFLSLDVLSDPDFRRGRGLVEATYKHDCDSFKWVFLYVCCIDTPNSAVKQWHTNDPEKCLRAKSDFLLPVWQGDPDFGVSAEYKGLIPQAYLIFNDLHKAHREASDARHRHFVRLQYKKALADEKIVRQPQDSPFALIMLTVDTPKRRVKPPMPLQEPEEEPAPVAVGPDELWNVFMDMLELSGYR